MSTNDSSTNGSSQLELELYFLIAKFLEAGPCQEASKALKRELDTKKLLPKRTDWEGREHYRSFENLCHSNRHISSSHLLQICQRIGPLLDKDIPPSVKGVMSLLGAGRQSVLRTAEDVKHIHWNAPFHVACHNGQPLMPPRNLAHPPIIPTIVNARQISGVMRPDHARPGKGFYTNLKSLTRSLGHLSAVYCVCFDRRGDCIITGADDALVKIWSAVSGRLLATLRGHSAEITDMTVNFENTLLATGSCDKNIRVWSLRSTAPVAVLHGHTGMITMIQFCPLVRGDTRYLASTGGDGCVCFWEWNVRSNKFNPKPTKFVERSRAGTQMLCMSFSPGGIFLATGSSDHVVRVYCLAGYCPEKISELESHTDSVDSIQYSHCSSRFLTGSKDGTARIWRYARQQWRSIPIDVSVTLPGHPNPPDEDGKPHKFRVTMVSWSQDDNSVLTAVSDWTIKVWDSHTGKLAQVLRGHEDEVYVLEKNPVDSRLLLSAAHDGHIIVWDISTGTIIKNHFNLIQGQGHGAVFDCKWAPDGLSFAATDSHGFILYFGFGCTDKFKRLPDHQFFHTDYRPLIRDANNYVLDEQTQQPPHLMPPPFLVDMDGNPYPPHYQRLVPGRESCVDSFLIPMVGVTPSGDREVLDEAIAEAPEEEQQEQLQQQQQQQQQQPGGAQEGDEDRPIIDHLIERMQREQDERIVAAGGAPLLSPSREGPLSPPPWGPRRSMDGEGAPRLSFGSSSGEGPSTGRDGASTHRDDDPGEGTSSQGPSSQPLEGASPPASHRGTNMSFWRKHKCMKRTDCFVLKNGEKLRLQMAEVELKMYISEKKKKPLPPSGTDSSDSCTQIRTRKRKKMHSRNTRANAAEETTVNRLVARALYDTEEEEEDTAETEEHEMEVEEEEDMEMWHSNASDSGESSDYSDWTADTGVNLQPPKRASARVPKKKRFSSSDEDSSDEDVDVEADVEAADDAEHEGGSRRKRPSPSRARKKRPPPKKKKRETRREKQQRRVMNQQEKSPIRELPEQFRPPDWLSDTLPRRAPYVPQMGDEVIYFKQGHELYVQAVKKRSIYDINPNKNQPWHKITLRESELVKIVGIKYEIRPPRLVCLKLAFIDRDKGKLTGGTFTIKYHDMPDVIDFLVLRQDYDMAMQRNWRVGSRFRCMIDDAWWTGKIASEEPLQEEYQDSFFQCLNVHWDNGEREKMSPWDLEPIDKKRLPPETGGSILVTPEEVKAMLYTPKPGEWPACGRDDECDRIIHGLEQIMELAIAEAFLVPVDLNAFPVYAMVVAYPIDLSTIKGRLENRYYRRVSSLQYDVRYVESNARTFNEANSPIVKYAKLIVELILRFISDSDCTDPMPIYSQLTKDTDFAVAGQRRSTNDNDDSDNDLGEGTSSGRGRKGSSAISKRRGSEKAQLDPDAWKQSCRELLDEMLEHEDSGPFREPVNIEQYPDYYQVIDHPVDLGAIREQLDKDEYSDPLQFCKHIRLMFNNSRSYNTNKRSKIYTMTLRLSFMFEDHIKDIISDWNTFLKYEKSGRVPRTLSLRKRKPRKRVRDLSTSSGSPGAAGLNISPGQPSTSAASGSATGSGSQWPRRGVAPTRTPGSGRGTLSSSRRETASQNVSPGSSGSQSRREERASKRKRLPSSSDDQEESSSSSTSAAEDKSESDSDYEGPAVRPRPSRQKKKKKQPVRTKSKGKQVMNGHAQRYSTRCATGKMKRRRYGLSEEDDDQTEEEEEEEQMVPEDRTNHTSSDSDTEAASASDTSDAESASSELDVKKTPASSESDAKENPKSSGSDTEEYSEDEEIPAQKQKTRTSRQSPPRASRPRQGRSQAMVRESRETRETRELPPRRSSILNKGQRRTRNQGRRTVHYQEHSDIEDMQNSGSDSDEDRATTVSSRGRVRRLTPRARAMFGD